MKSVDTHYCTKFRQKVSSLFVSIYKGKVGGSMDLRAWIKALQNASTGDLNDEIRAIILKLMILQKED